MSTRTTKIEHGIEYYDIIDDATNAHVDEDAQCARCGSSVEWIRCANCCGDGYSHHDCGEDTCCCADPLDNVPCDWCKGEGGWAHCLSSPEWCESHPMPGREHIKSTAMSPEAWRDAD